MTVSGINWQGMSKNQNTFLHISKGVLNLDLIKNHIEIIFDICDWHNCNLEIELPWIKGCFISYRFKISMKIYKVYMK